MLSALASVTASADDYNMTQPYFYWGEAPFNVSEEAPHNVSEDDGGGGTGVPVFPGYIRTTAMVLCLLILGVGVVGNVMVPLVILKSKDMRNSTNIFLLNLSVADLMVLLVCTPTVLVEVNSPPETWVLGQEMCKAVPFVEMTVAHASVLTILAISFERYYAICEPLKAGYVCTKARAMLICLMAWAVAAIFTSPILGIAEYHYELYYDGSVVAVCLTQADTFWRALFFIFSNSFFFFVPLLILVVLYTIIARHLMTHPGIIANNNNSGSHVLRYRKQVVMMLGTVVVSFFICLLPFRALIFWIIIAPSETLYSLGAEAYYNLLFFCRIMFYLNSAVNPILYNLMSSKFRDGFMRLCGLRRRTSDLTHLGRRGTFNTTSTTTTTCSGNHRSSPESFWRRSVKSQRNSVKLFDAAKLPAPVGEVEKLMRNGSVARAAKCNNNKNSLIRPGLPEKCSCSITENGGSGVCSLQSHDESYV